MGLACASLVTAAVLGCAMSSAYSMPLDLVGAGGVRAGCLFGTVFDADASDDGEVCTGGVAAYLFYLGGWCSALWLRLRR